MWLLMIDVLLGHVSERCASGLNTYNLQMISQPLSIQRMVLSSRTSGRGSSHSFILYILIYASCVVTLDSIRLAMVRPRGDDSMGLIIDIFQDIMPKLPTRIT